MSDYIGTREQVDEYVGSRLVEAAYLGSRKYFDAYSEITGLLPIIFKSRAAVALKNYRIYGTENGAGVETENLFNVKQGYMYYSRYVGLTLCKLDIQPGETIYLTRTTELYTRIAYYDANNTRLTASAYVTEGYASVVVRELSNLSYCIVEFKNPEGTILTAQQAATIAETVVSRTIPTKFVPFGYKIPLTITSGAQSQDIPIYIGSSKLGEDEYVDYVEQKVYKRTENLWDSDDFWDNGHRFINNPILFGYAYSVPSGTYTISTNVIDNVDTSIASIFAIAAAPNQDPSISSSNNGVFVNRPRTVTVGENQALWIMIRVAKISSQDYLIWNKETFSNYWIMLNAGSTAEPYAPYLQPTDPPAPLPAILTYQGENTLSSTEALGECSVTGRINSVTP